MEPADDRRLVHALLEDAAGEDGAAPFITFMDMEGDPTAELSRGEAWRASRILGGALRRAGVERGDRVAVMLGNCPEFVSTLFGTSLVGAVSIPLNTSSRGDQLAAMLEETEPVIAFVDEATAPEVVKAAANVPSLRHLVVAGSTEVAGDERATGYASFVEGAEEAPPVDLGYWDLTSLLFTSGTTGRSKGVMCSHNMLVDWARLAQRAIGYSENDIAFTCLPLFHGNGLVTTLLAATLARARVAVAPRFSASKFWNQVVRSGATTTNLLGAMGTILWRQDPSELERAHKLRIILMVPSPPEYYDAFEERFGLRLTEVYGLTDNGMPLGIPPGERRPGSCGVPAPGWECAVVNEQDEPVEQGEVGELVVRSLRPYLGMSGYWRRPEATVEAWRNLWFHTGDYVRQDVDGYYYFVDRRKDSLRRGGENVSSFEVEQVLLSHPDVANAAVYGVPHEVLGAEVMAAVVLRPGSTFSPEALIEYCTPRLPKYAVPRYLRAMDAFPMTETEKVQKSQLRDEGLTTGTWDRRARQESA